MYIVLRSAEEKDKWIYYLKKAADDPSMNSTPFEMLIQKMMALNIDDGEFS